MKTFALLLSTTFLTQKMAGDENTVSTPYLRFTFWLSPCRLRSGEGGTVRNRGRFHFHSKGKMWNGISQFHDTWNLEYSTGIGIEFAGTNHTSLRRNSTTLYVPKRYDRGWLRFREKGNNYYFTYDSKYLNIIYVVHTYIQMENSIPIPQGKPGMEWNGIWNIPWWNRPLVRKLRVMDIRPGKTIN
jgi:hypothetical protein